MMATQEFIQSHDEVKKLIRILQDDLNNRENLIKGGQNPAKVNLVLQQQSTKVSNQIKSMFDAFSQEEKAQSIPKSELDKRRKMLYDLQNSFDDVNQKVQNAKSPSKVGHLFTPSNNNTSYKDYRDPNTVSIQVLKEDKQAFDVEFDKKVNQLSDATSTLKKGQIDMSDELTYQNELLLPKLENGMEENNIRLFKNNAKLSRILNKSSQCKLWLCLLIEFLALLLLLFIF